MKKKLIELYHAVACDWNLAYEEKIINQGIFTSIKNLLEEFMQKCQNPAIWCYGNHTKMLMTDFIFECKNVKYIIDEKYKNVSSNGFEIISKKDIYNKKIDGIIISSYKYKEEIKEYIKENYPEILYLDFYENLEKQGIKCMSEYYNQAHPYEYYRRINNLQRKIKQRRDNKDIIPVFEEVIGLYVHIKDFLNAIRYTELYLQIINSDENYQKLERLKVLYRIQKKCMKQIVSSNVLMLCIDGLRSKDISKSTMPNLTEYLEKEMLWFHNAYSISTSTYESLIPAYSENLDMRTKYYEQNYVEEKDCRYIKIAKEQNRNVFFYTDFISFIRSECIHLKNETQTASEKIWDFLLDAIEEENGLFYIHILYESHFSYPNPYTDKPIIAEGTSVFFDFLPVNGEKIKTDYEKQHIDALRYLDDTIVPLIKNLNINMVLYADHGNVILKENTIFDEITYPMLTFAEDLIRIPFAIRKCNEKAESREDLISLIEINDVLVSLLKNKKIVIPKRQYVKVQRSKIYNPDFQYIYQKLNFEKGLDFFELFVWDTGVKLIVYSDGTKELYDLNDNKLHDDEQLNKLYSIIENEVTILEKRNSNDL